MLERMQALYRKYRSHGNQTPRLPEGTVTFPHSTEANIATADSGDEAY